MNPSIQNFLQISPLLGTAGQPFREQFPAIKAAGYAAVINLARPDSLDAVADEAELLADLGVAYYHIPVEWQNPQRGDLEQFFDVMKSLEGQKVFVHCARNMRVSVFVYLYRVLHKSEGPLTCWEDVLKIWRPDDVWQKFIGENLNP